MQNCNLKELRRMIEFGEVLIAGNCIIAVETAFIERKATEILGLEHSG